MFLTIFSRDNFLKLFFLKVVINIFYQTQNYKKNHCRNEYFYNLFPIKSKKIDLCNKVPNHNYEKNQYTFSRKDSVIFFHNHLNLQLFHHPKAEPPTKTRTPPPPKVESTAPPYKLTKQLRCAAFVFTVIRPLLQYPG